LSEHIKVKRPKVEQRVMKTFSEAELKAIVSYKPRDFHEARMHAMLCLIIDTGIRINEALSLRRHRIDPDNLLVTIRGKGDEERIDSPSVERRKGGYPERNTRGAVEATQGKKPILLALFCLFSHAAPVT
jgi:integrase